MSDTSMMQRTGHSTKLIALAFAAAIVSVTIARQRYTKPVEATPSAAAEVISASSLVRGRPDAAAIASAPRREGIFRDANGIHIDARGMPRTQAVEHLAALTRARITNGSDLLALAPPLNLRWQGHDAAEAWKRVLGGANLRHGIVCDASACSISISSIDLTGGSVLVTEDPPPIGRHGTNPQARLMNRPTEPDAIDETSLDP